MKCFVNLTKIINIAIIKNMRKNKGKSKFLNKSIGKKIKDALLPTEENDYSPRALCFKSLSVIVVLLVLFKVFVTLFLFSIYPRFVYLSTDIYNQVIELTNKTRIENGVPLLEANSILDKAANAKAQDMLLGQYFSHDTPDGKKPWHWIDKKEYDYVNAGENLAMNFTSAEVAHLALLQSDTHKRNIVNPKFTDIGVAILTGEMNGKKTMVMVEMFGRRRGVVETMKHENNETMKHEISETRDRNSEVAVVRGVNEEMQEQDEEIEKFRNLEIESALSETSDEVRENQSDVLMVSSVDPGIQEVSVKSSILKFKSNLINSLLNYLDYVLYAGLFFIMILLVLNILIKVRIQRLAVIFQSMMTIGIIIILIISKLHFFQNLATKVIVG
jgi:uncharacterized protein YkwD